MDINQIVAMGRKEQASDLHIEDGQPVCLRADGTLRFTDNRLSSDAVLLMARKLTGNHWERFLEQGSFDLSRVIEKTRCRINIFRSARGLAIAVRLLMSRPVSVNNLNLNPDLLKISEKPHGLVLFSGATGSGKSTSMAALIEEINHASARHIITLEHPVEYFFSSRKSLIRQREVGRDTPSFAQGLKDALREDPDVLVVGEMRDPETMRLTLNAAETGHLVFATVHSATVAESVARLVGSFCAEEQEAVRAQLADSLAAVVCQRMTYREGPGIRVPECELLFSNSSVKSVLRSGNFVKLRDCILTGAGDSMWSLERYRGWLREKTQWVRMENFRDCSPDPVPVNNCAEQVFVPSRASVSPVRRRRRPAGSVGPAGSGGTGEGEGSDAPVIIDDPGEDLNSILSELDSFR